MPSEAVDGMNPESVHEAMEKALAHARSGKGPYFLELKTYRYRGHSVSDPAKYRSKDEVAEYKERDPLTLIENKLLGGIASEKEVKAIQDKIAKEIDDAVEFAENSNFPPGSALYEDNYLQEDYPFIMD